ncbi:MAG: enoyl-acyl carrier protein reductase II [Bacillota bacterium]|nr:MAG: enoyl-acyl carrier protein reductase II [Bacillota bacterium]MBS3951020.1 enoyl-[acyl-carrier-protein] reductase FabK [Peptococcaceae bacterium]
MDRLRNLLGIEFPVLQGGMAWVATAKLAAAVSAAGGLGIIGAGHAPAEWVRQEIRKARSITSKPFGVNVMLMSPCASEVMQVVVEERVPVVTTGAGSPGPFIEALKSVGCKVIPVVASVALAKRLERMGADAVVAEGLESGGHIGEISTMALVPQVVDAVNIPVIAAGGIADGRGIAAALMLGASGVQLGTRFICAIECEAHKAYKDAVVGAGDRDAIVCGLSTGHPVRSLKNQLTREYLQLEKQGASEEELERLGVGRLRLAFEQGDVRNGSLMAGQSAGLVKEIIPAREIIISMVKETERLMGRRIWTN